MKTLWCAFAFCLWASVLACSKDGSDEEACNEPTDVPETMNSIVEPSRFLPAYPGSWWHYSDGSVISTADTYTRSAVLSNNWDPNHGVDRCCIPAALKLPIYDGLPLYGYVRMRADAPSTLSGSCCERLLSENLGEVYRWGGDHYGRTQLKTMAIDTTITLSSGIAYTSVIMVKRVNGIAANYFNTTHTYTLTFYAPDVGLVKEVRVAWPDTTTRELTDHWIAGH